ncbi:expressed unknown protein [Ectocarpus siliculosus]|uniref:Uncharacterized protein n=1 Tax=Ectocarpus siliculosus TaxID=2880 RepID=D7G891_ECTSI|nr:expressed unknown protein [Ectocarpus siliculosus]|eukprot:CBJ34028.1 expressed unknown protein [Ectocarpus siliculosus]
MLSVNARSAPLVDVFLARTPAPLCCGDPCSAWEVMQWVVDRHKLRRYCTVHVLRRLPLNQG